MTKTLIPIENLKTNGQHKNATKNFDYTTIADKLRTISWSNKNDPTGVAKPVYGYQRTHISKLVNNHPYIDITSLYRLRTNSQRKWGGHKNVVHKYKLRSKGVPTNNQRGRGSGSCHL